MNHRGSCEQDGCSRVWRENCEDCLTEVTARHTAATGHRVHLAVSPDGEPLWELRRMTRQARLVLLRPKRGW